MQPKSKLMILELISGILGWLWIIAGVAALYFLVSAIGFHGRWSSFVLALIISLVAKWLSKGFLENKQRVAYEAELINKGYTPEQAGREWIQRYTGSTTISDSEDISSEEAEKVIQAYGSYLAVSAPVSGTVADVSRLPYSKAKIKRAILIGLGAVQDIQQKEMLKIGFMQLANFQEGVGEKNIGLDISNLDVGKADIDELAQQVLNQTEGFDKWKRLVKEEEEVLKSELQKAGYW